MARQLPGKAREEKETKEQRVARLEAQRRSREMALQYVLPAFIGLLVLIYVLMQLVVMNRPPPVRVTDFVPPQPPRD